MRPRRLRGNLPAPGPGAGGDPPIAYPCKPGLFARLQFSPSPILPPQMPEDRMPRPARSRPARSRARDGLRRVRQGLAMLGFAGLAACTVPDAGPNAGPVENRFLPAADRAATAAAAAPMRWDGRAGGDAWTAATLTAIDRHGDAMVARIPSDIAAFCPGYAQQDAEGRSAFWAGLMSSLAKHESTWNPRASGGGGKWLGLMQIAPATWRGYGCTGEMFNGADNMACAIRIASHQVGRDNAIVGASGSWRGVARDWAPMRSAAKRADIAGWTAAQPYCARPDRAAQGLAAPAAG